MRTLCIVGASFKRIWDLNPRLGAVEARKAYLGNLFRLSTRYAEKFYKGSWVILSPSLGYVFPDEKIIDRDKIEPSKMLNDSFLARLVAQAREKSLDLYSSVIVLGGNHYVEAVEYSLPFARVYFPLRRLRYGEKLTVLKQALRKNTPFPLVDEFA